MCSCRDVPGRKFGQPSDRRVSLDHVRHVSHNGSGSTIPTHCSASAIDAMRSRVSSIPDRASRCDRSTIPGTRRIARTHRGIESTSYDSVALVPPSDGSNRYCHRVDGASRKTVSKVSSRPGSHVVITHSRDQRTPDWRLWPLNLAPISGPDASPTHSTRWTVGLHSAVRVTSATNDQTDSGVAAICLDTSSRITAMSFTCFRISHAQASAPAAPLASHRCWGRVRPRQGHRCDRHASRLASVVRAAPGGDGTVAPRSSTPPPRSASASCRWCRDESPRSSLTTVVNRRRLVT